jgi:tetratricopeptide (TPR) repeat protein
MTEARKEEAFSLLNRGAYQESLPILQAVIADDPSDWNSIYLAGQCWRFMGEMNKAIELLKQALSLNTEEPSILLALGIAQQLDSRFSDAISSFKDAIKLNPDYTLAYNSLALTYRKSGEPARAMELYDVGLKSLTRTIVKNLTNRSGNRIFKHAERGASLWLEHAMFGAMYLVASDEAVDTIAFPNGTMAMQEETDETHRGLFWIDQNSDDDETTRLFLPNYFNTFMQLLFHEKIYSELIGNKGVVLEILGEKDEAEAHFEEANAFSP